MINLLFTVIGAEMILIVLLLFKTPLRKLVIMGLDKVKRGKGLLMAKTVAGTVVLVLASSVYSMMKKRSVHAGIVNPTDQVLMAKHLLESSLLGFSLFLAWMTDRLHYYIRELRLLRKSMEAVKKQRLIDDAKGGVEEVKAMEEDITNLKEKLKKLESVNKQTLKAAEAKKFNLGLDEDPFGHYY